MSAIRGSTPSGKVSVSGARFGPVKGTVRSSGSRQLNPSRMANPPECTSLRCQWGAAAGGTPGTGADGSSVIRSTRTW
ncbi:hypothetical protein GCM10010504_40270 [Streptomyces griseus]|nr:hypothetical protein GCM10010504_40270 [Streptomyces griseus]